MIIEKSDLPKKYFNHELGQFYSKEDEKYAYIPIPKNASSLLKYIFRSKYKWKNIFNYKFSDTSDKIFLVCFRDPIDRWTTGIAEYIYRNHKDCDLNNKDLLKFIFERIIFDEHTEPQVNFIHGLDTSNIIFFKHEKVINNILKKFINTHIDKNFNWEIDAPLKLNSSGMKSNKTNNVNILKQEIFSNLYYHNMLTDIYQKDMELMNSVNFYH